MLNVSLLLKCTELSFTHETSWVPRNTNYWSLFQNATISVPMSPPCCTVCSRMDHLQWATWAGAICLASLTDGCFFPTWGGLLRNEACQPQCAAPRAHTQSSRVTGSFLDLLTDEKIKTSADQLGIRHSVQQHWAEVGDEHSQPGLGVPLLTGLYHNTRVP